ncbi:uncharacterized protein J3R85_009112 [Psidium guajava]|nr:uncharacterized protein J3R85_009112 [Psidium guajava]
MSAAIGGWMKLPCLTGFLFYLYLPDKAFRVIEPPFPGHSPQPRHPISSACKPLMLPKEHEKKYSTLMDFLKEELVFHAQP